jgi:hypothetical protein
MIMLIWKISNGAVQGYNIKFQFNQRRGWLAIPTSVKQGSHVTVRRAREASLAHRGALLFNVCPQGIRNMATEHFLDWKTNLDTWLAEIPDLIPTKLIYCQKLAMRGEVPTPVNTLTH